MFRSKVWTLPNLNMVIAMTGTADIGDIWYSQIVSMPTVRDIEDLNEYAPATLRAIRAHVEQNNGPSGHSTVRQFGFPHGSDKLVQYTYSTRTEHFGTTDIFEPVKTTGNKFGVIPGPQTFKTEAAYSPEEKILLASRIRAEQNEFIAAGKKGNNEENGVAIGGELYATWIETGVINSRLIHRFPDYDETWQQIVRRTGELQQAARDN